MPATQKIFGLARPAPTVTWADMVPVMQSEAAYVWSLYERNILRAAWMRTDALGAVYVLESTPAQALRVLAGQPLARDGLVEFELIPVGPFTPLSLLFGTQPRPILPAQRPRTRGQTSVPVLAIGRVQRAAAPDAVALDLAQEAHRAWGLCKGGVIRETYRRTDRPGVALVLEIEGVPEAHAVLAELPLVGAGLIEFECFSLATFVGFDALLEGSLDDVPQQLADPTHHHDRRDHL